ncbi:MAG: hypothetical protein ACJ0IB_02815 [Verrucomicrobiales bacterium]
MSNVTSSTTRNLNLGKKMTATFKDIDICLTFYVLSTCNSIAPKNPAAPPPMIMTRGICSEIIK